MPILSNLQLLFQTFALAGSIVFLVPLLSYIYDLHALSNKHLPGPPNNSFFGGNQKDLFEDEDASIYTKWIEQYGRIHNRATFFGRSQITVADLKGISFILRNSYDYPKHDSWRFLLSRVTGRGVLTAAREEHRKQRRVMNPAFEFTQIKDLTKIFLEKSIELRDAWSTIIGSDEIGHVDALSWLSRMTLDVIGKAGFNYDFQSLQGEPNELNVAFSEAFRHGVGNMSLPVILKMFFPILRILPETDKVLRQAQTTIFKIGKQLLADAKATLSVEAKDSKDILSLLVHSNMSQVLAPDQRMSDDQVLAQVPTFLVAGHESTGTATAWAFLALCENIDAQDKLRNELLSVSTDTPSMDQLNALPYLDAVVKEALRLYAPVFETSRVALKDDVIPLDEPFTDKHGVVYRELRIKKGQELGIPIIALNRDKKLWGEDALVFRPERWEDLPDAVSGIPGIVNHLMTFIGGPTACIGWRFALVEMKALLFVLVRSFEFKLAVPRDEVLIKQGFPIHRPFVKSSGRHELPLLLRLVVA